MRTLGPVRIGVDPGEGPKTASLTLNMQREEAGLNQSDTAPGLPLMTSSRPQPQAARNLPHLGPPISLGKPPLLPPEQRGSPPSNLYLLNLFLLLSHLFLLPLLSQFRSPLVVQPGYRQQGGHTDQPRMSQGLPLGSPKPPGCSSQTSLLPVTADMEHLTGMR